MSAILASDTLVSVPNSVKEATGAEFLKSYTKPSAIILERSIVEVAGIATWNKITPLFHLFVLPLYLGYRQSSICNGLLQGKCTIP